MQPAILITDTNQLDDELRETIEDALMDYKEIHGKLPETLTIADALLPSDLLKKKCIEIDGQEIPLDIFHLPLRQISTRGQR